MIALNNRNNAEVSPDNLNEPRSPGCWDGILMKFRRLKASTFSKADLRSSFHSDLELNANEDECNVRGNWGQRVDFLLSCIGYAVGLGNIWRFPFKVLSNGGASFIIAYILMLAILAMPLFLVELAMGQFSSRGVSECWHFAPGLKGMGYIMLLMSLFCSLYYNNVIAWAFYYCGWSFSPTLPWLNCKNHWNDYMCRPSYFTGVANISKGSVVEMSSEQFFERNVVTAIKTVAGGAPIPRHITDNPETIVWYTALCLIAAWVLCAIILVFGIKVSGKSMYFFATYPYFVLIIMIICGATLEGSSTGIVYYFTPKMEFFLKVKTWRDAAEQIFFSLGIGFGSMLTFGSYNKFSDNLERDVIIIACINSLTSIFGGIAVFEILGFMAYRYDSTVLDMSKYAGAGLIFIAYPEGLSQFKGQNVLCFLFFTMILCLGLDSQLGMMETVITGLMDEFPFLRKTKVHRYGFVIILNAICCLFALVFVTKTGFLWYIVMSYYSVATNLLLMGFFESVAIAYVYGINNFSRDLKMMLGFKLSWYWKICLLGPVPIVTLVLTIYAMATATRTVIGSGYKEVVFPLWADALGWIIFTISLIPLPIYYLYYILNNIFVEKTGVLASFKNSVQQDMFYGPGLKKNWHLHEYYKKKLEDHKADPVFLNNFRQ